MEDSEEGLDEWAKGKFGVGGRFTGQLYGNTDWALARKVWSAALEHAKNKEKAVEDINAQICIGDDYELSENELYQIEQILTYRSMREEDTDIAVD